MTIRELFEKTSDEFSVISYRLREWFFDLTLWEFCALATIFIIFWYFISKHNSESKKAMDEMAGF